MQSPDDPELQTEKRPRNRTLNRPEDALKAWQNKSDNQLHLETLITNNGRGADTAATERSNARKLSHHDFPWLRHRGRSWGHG